MSRCTSSVRQRKEYERGLREWKGRNTTERRNLRGVCERQREKLVKLTPRNYIESSIAVIYRETRDDIHGAQTSCWSRMSNQVSNIIEVAHLITRHSFSEISTWGISWNSECSVVYPSANMQIQRPYWDSQSQGLRQTCIIFSIAALIFDWFVLWSINAESVSNPARSFRRWAKTRGWSWHNWLLDFVWSLWTTQGEPRWTENTQEAWKCEQKIHERAS